MYFIIFLFYIFNVRMLLLFIICKCVCSFTKRYIPEEMHKCGNAFGICKCEPQRCIRDKTNKLRIGSVDILCVISI